MPKYQLGWQSWSPPQPNLFHLPRRDYSPIPATSAQPDCGPSPTTNHPSSLNYWCSWYALGYLPNPEDIIKQAKLIKLNKLNISYILIDDGWREEWLPTISQTLHRLGFKVGLWYAPFTRHRNLPLKPTLSRLITSAKLDLVKLDFLYYPYFHPSTFPDPDGALHSLYHYLSTNFPNVTTIACGAPFHPTIGKVDVIRVSKDTALPYPAPSFINKPFYAHRVKMLSQKYLALQKKPLFNPDPDVRMFSLDDAQTDELWGKMSFSVKGIGDRIDNLSPTQIKKASLWLK